MMSAWTTQYKLEKENSPKASYNPRRLRSLFYLEDLDSHGIGQLLCVSLDLDVKGQDDGVLLLVLEHHRSLHHVALHDRANFHARKLTKKVLNDDISGDSAQEKALIPIPGSWRS